MNIRSRGFVLILIIFLLATFAALGVQFSLSAQLSRKLATHSLESTRARLLARSGVHKAIAACYVDALKTPAETGRQAPWKFFGADRDGNGILSDDEQDLQGGPPGLEHCLRPSFARLDATGITADLVTVGSNPVGYSWMDSLGGIVSLRVRAANSLIDLNGGVDRTPDRDDFDSLYDINATGSSATSLDYAFNQPTVSLLNSLGRYLIWHDTVRDPAETFDWNAPMDDSRNLNNAQLTMVLIQSGPGLGDRIVSARPEGGFTTVSEIEAPVLEWATDAGLDPNTALNTVLDLVTVHADRDPTTRLWRQYGLPYHHVRTDDPHMPQVIPWAYRDQDNARLYLRTRSYEFPRLLIDVNSAPEPVLAALIHSVRSVWLRREIMPGVGSLNSCHVQLAAYPAPTMLMENGRPNARDVGGFFQQVRVRNLFSMTESIRIARTLIGDRATDPIDSRRRFHDWLVDLDCGYDHRSASSFGSLYTGVLDPANDQHARQLWRFVDDFDFNQRFRILADILNPNGDLRHFCTESALPPTSRKSEFRHQPVAYRPFNHSYQHWRNRYSLGRVGTLGNDVFDKSYPHIAGSHVTFAPSGRFLIESLGRSLGNEGRVRSRATVSCASQLWQAHTLTSQADFVDMLATGLGTGNPHDALGRDWITGPEVVLDQSGPCPFGTEPANWDGQLALCPESADIRGPALPLTTHISLNGYRESAPEDLFQQRISSGPQPEFLHERHAAHVDALTKKYHPGFWPPHSSQVAGSDATGPDLDRHSLLSTGGGYRPDASCSVMENNLTGHLPQRTTDVRIGGFCLEDRSSSGRHVFESIDSGAVSFWYKPRSLPLASVAQGADPDNTYRMWSRTPHCLFDYSFFIQDNELKNRIEAELHAMGYSSAIDTQSGLIRANIRLLFGNMWSTASDVQGAMNTRLNISPLNQRRHKINSGLWAYRWYQQETANNLVLPACDLVPSPTGHTVTLFPAMSGMTGADGMPGYLVDGDESPFDWYTAREDHQPYVAEKIWLEFKVAIVTDAKPVVDTGSGLIYKQVIGLPAGTEPYLADGDFIDLYESTQQSYTPSDIPLFAGREYSGRTTATHTVAKSFRVDHPVVLDPSSDLAGSGPRDAEGLPQSMLSPGRWHHFLIAWKDMRNLLLLNNDTTRGGSVAVYHNGTLGRTIPLDGGSDPATGYQYKGLMWHNDYSTAYYNTAIYRESLSHIQNPSLGNYETAAEYAGHNNMNLMFPAMRYDIENSIITRPRYYPVNGAGNGLQYTIVQGLGMETEGYPSPMPTASNPADSSGVYYLKGSLGNFSGHTTQRIASGSQIHDNYNVMHFAAHKLFFGSAPAGRYRIDGGIFDDGHNRSVSTHKYPADGTFMNIQTSHGVDNFLLDGSGRFRPDNPYFDQVSLFSNRSHFDANPAHNSRIFPFKAAATRNLAGRRLIGYSWTCWLPEFHTFWDDTNARSFVWDETTGSYGMKDHPGPDPADQQILEWIPEVNIGDPDQAGPAHSWSKVAELHPLFAEQSRPRTLNRSLVTVPGRFRVPEGEHGFSFRMDFRIGNGTGGTAHATPLVDDVTLFTIPPGGPRVLDWKSQ